MVAAAMTAAMLNSVRCASIAKGPESASVEQAAELKQRLSASNGVLNIWDRDLVPSARGGSWGDRFDWERRTKFEYNHTVEVNTYAYEEGALLSGWMIAVIVIVPLVVLIGIVVLCVCICRGCAGRKVYTSHVYQAGPPPYPVSAGMQAGHNR